jgi:putative acetyltransferase
LSAGGSPTPLDLPVDPPACRPATADDVPALARLYAETARALGPACYSAAQVSAWCSFGQDTPAFRAYVLDADTWLAVGSDGEVLGFCGVGGAGDAGEVHSLYVHHALVRRGLGSRLLGDALLRARRRGVTRFAAWVTPFSRPVFERAGFRLLRTVVEPYQGVEFERYRVESMA